MKIKSVLVVYTITRNKIQRDTIELVRRVLKKNNIKFKVILREKLKKKHYRNKDIVIAAGGDGTFLMASHHIDDNTPMLGVNSDPSCREGFFMASDKKDFEKKFDEVLESKFRIRKLHRLEAHIDDKKIKELALNEFYIASEKPYHTARYYLTVRGKRERQKSSGVLVSSAAGSYAWVKSAGGKELPIESDNFEYIIREPYCGRTAAKCSLSQGILKKNEKVIMEFEIGNGVIIADSTATEHIFKAKQKVTIKLSDKPIHSICF
ncbi:NAD(+)/NADH kinase [Candidatus Woesearchaeota archaeon]|nr:NAD(+)/NADH kinase [Candidatus Woesearchaeota archaeon]